jgi:hypothetical protein
MFNPPMQLFVRKNQPIDSRLYGALHVELAISSPEGTVAQKFDQMQPVWLG